MLRGIKSTLKRIPLIQRWAYGFLMWQRENIVDAKGRDNSIQAHGARLERNQIRIQGNHNVLIFAPGASVQDCSIEILGDHHTLYIGEHAVLTKSLLWFEDHHCEIKIGQGTTMQRNGHIAVTEPYRKILIGSDCMFSFDVDIRNGDSHSILEKESGKRVNWAKNITIGNHVWLGAYTQVLGGATIGENSIIGIRSMVNGIVPADSIAVGIPARVAKKGFTWDSQRFPDGDPGPNGLEKGSV
jgi:acetyltransferase-like isoleucine patch superfamily enzyme